MQLRRESNLYASCLADEQPTCQGSSEVVFEKKHQPTEKPVPERGFAPVSDRHLAGLGQVREELPFQRFLTAGMSQADVDFKVMDQASVVEVVGADADPFIDQESLGVQDPRLVLEDPAARA